MMTALKKNNKKLVKKKILLSERKMKLTMKRKQSNISSNTRINKR